MFSLSEIPKKPGVYILRDRNGEVAYVGISKDVRSRIDQHLNRRDSSISTGVSTTMLNPDFVTKVEWWIRDLFSEKDARKAAELIAFQVFEPSLRSRGKPSTAAQEKFNDPGFKAQIEEILESPPDGFHIPKNLDNLCLIVANLMKEVEDLRSRMLEKNIL